MAGWFLGAIDRAPIGTWSIVTGSAVSGFPVSNLGTTYLGNQAKITPSGGAVVVMCDMGAPSVQGTGGDVDFQCNFWSAHNHNIDGLSMALYAGTSSTFGAATLISSASLTNYAGFAHPLLTFTTRANRYWFFAFAAGSGGMPSTVNIGHLGLGYGWDIGSPLRPHSPGFAPQGETVGDGYGAPGRLDMPQASWNGIFRGQSVLTHNKMTNFSKDGSGNYVGYNALLRAFADAYQISLASGNQTRTGLCAGAGRPMPYHRGSEIYALSAGGRPAGYGVMRINPNLFWARNLSMFSLQIADVQPRGALVAPAT